MTDQSTDRALLKRAIETGNSEAERLDRAGTALTGREPEASEIYLERAADLRLLVKIAEGHLV